MTWTNEEIREALRDTLAGNEGHPHAMHRQAHHTAHYTPMATGEALADGWDTITWETPSRTPTTAGDVVVPLAQAGISGAMAAILAAVTIEAARWEMNLWPAVAIGAATAASVWAALLRDHRRLLRTVETWERPQTPPEATGDAQRAPAGIRLEIAQETPTGAAHWLLQDLATDPDTFRRWADAVTRGRSLAQSGWTGAGGQFSRAEYDQLLAAMIRAGVARWKNPRAHAQGCELTPMGRATLRKYTEEATE